MRIKKWIKSHSCSSVKASPKSIGVKFLKIKPQMIRAESCLGNWEDQSNHVHTFFDILTNFPPMRHHTQASSFYQNGLSSSRSEVRKYSRMRKSIGTHFPCIWLVYKIMFNTFFHILDILAFRSSNCQITSKYIESAKNIIFPQFPVFFRNFRVFQEIENILKFLDLLDFCVIRFDKVGQSGLTRTGQRTYRLLYYYLNWTRVWFRPRVLTIIDSRPRAGQRFCSRWPLLGGPRHGARVPCTLWMILWRLSSRLPANSSGKLDPQANTNIYFSLIDSLLDNRHGALVMSLRMLK